MQLDRTEIVIRQRSSLELLDLTLLVLRRHGLQIALSSLLLAVPLLILDTLAVAWMLGEDARMIADDLSEPLTALRWRHATHLVLLYLVQFPIASLPTTIFLGNQIFFEPMPFGKLARRLLPIAWRCLLVLGVMRLGLVSLAMEFLVDRTQTFDWFAEFWLLFVVSGIALIIRACWPFAAEILGLELCRLGATRPGEITYFQRSRGLHSILVGDHIARAILAAFFGTLLGLMLLGIMIFIKGVTTGDWIWNAWFDHLCLPLAMWALGLYMAVFRFLTYLDSRIRLEGWEIELRLKAEANRLSAAVSTPADEPVIARERVSL